MKELGEEPQPDQHYVAQSVQTGNGSTAWNNLTLLLYFCRNSSAMTSFSLQRRPCLSYASYNTPCEAGKS